MIDLNFCPLYDLRLEAVFLVLWLSVPLIVSQITIWQLKIKAFPWGGSVTLLLSKSKSCIFANDVLIPDTGPRVYQANGSVLLVVPIMNGVWQKICETEKRATRP